MEGKFNQKEILESVGMIIAAIKTEIEKVGDPSKVFLGGFSQGCAIVLATYLHFDGVLGGVYGASGVFSNVMDWSKVDIAAKKSTPVMLYHGE